MTLATDIANVLDANEAVISYTQQRHYPDVIAQGAVMPAVCFQLVAGQREQDLAGSCSLYNGRYQFDCYALTALQANALRVAVCAALEAAVEEFAVVRGLEIDDYESATRRYRRTVEFSIWQNHSIHDPDFTPPIQVP